MSNSSKTNRNEEIHTILLLGLNMCIMVALHPVQKLLTTFRVPHMFHTEVDPLLDVTVANDLVNDDTDSIWGDVVHNAGSSVDSTFSKAVFYLSNSNVPVVVFVGHTLLLRRVGFNVDDVAYAVVDEECREFDGAVF
jgi:hypothetical protein